MKIVHVLGWDDFKESLTEFDKLMIEILKMQKHGKFVLGRNLNGDYALVLFDLDSIHVTVAEKFALFGYRFIGAGRYRIAGSGWHVEWDSETCFRKFYYDRPQNKGEADYLLGLVNQEIQAITENIKSNFVN